VSPTPPLRRVSTEMFPERDRFAAFREDFARRILNMDVVDRSDGRPYVDLAQMTLGPVAAGTLTTTPTEFIRDKRHVKDGADAFLIQVVTTGPVHCQHAGRDLSCDDGFAVFSHLDRPCRAWGVHPGRIGGSRNLTVPAAALTPLVLHPEDLAGQLLRPGPALRLLDGYLRSLMALEEAPPPALSQMIGTHLLDLLAAVLGPKAEAREMIIGRGLRASRQREIISEISLRYSDLTFDLDSLTRSLGLSRSYVQKLLEETGKSFTERVTERRLQRAYAMLTDPGFAHLRIVDIALASGFGDISHFNRMFRRSFGDTPTGVRAT
jgi:AraC-like DNA-binding protein